MYKNLQVKCMVSKTGKVSSCLTLILHFKCTHSNLPELLKTWFRWLLPLTESTESRTTASGWQATLDTVPTVA